MLELKIVQKEDRLLLRNILQKYMHEMSQFYDDPIDEDGNFQYSHFEEYFTDTNRTAYLIYDDNCLVGFALLNPYSCCGGKPDYTMAEFSILPSYRRKHLASDAVKAIFDKHPGKWEIKYNNKNTAAKNFWDKISSSYMPEKISLNAEETVLTLNVRRNEPMETFSCTEREQWRAWLSEHYDSCSEIWFVFPTKKSGEKCISYNDAVEEALCFGWIDGRAGTLDENHHIRRFTPRKKGSKYSQPNIERLIQLDAKGMIHPDVRSSVNHILSAEFVYPKNILRAIEKDEEAWKNFNNFPASYRRIRIAYISAAKKRPKEFKKRLANFIAKTHEGKMISGYGGIEKYYNA